MPDASDTANPPPPQLGRGRILLVDDKRNLRITTSLLLTSCGYAVFEATTGQEALDVLAHNRVDVLLTALRMEPMDGLTLLKKALEAVPELQVIIMTAFGSIESAAEAMRLGACDYLTRPFPADELQRRVERALEVARLQSQK